MRRVRQQLSKPAIAPRVCLVFALTLALGQISGCSLLRSVGLLPAEEEPEIAAIPLSEQPYEFTLILKTSANINPDAQSRPSPVRTRVFLTEADAALVDRSLEEIFQFNGEDLEPAPAITLMLRPGEAKRIKLSGVKSQDLLTVAVAYRDHYSVDWIVDKRVFPDKAVRYTADISASAIAITAQ